MKVTLLVKSALAATALIPVPALAQITQATPPAAGAGQTDDTGQASTDKDVVVVAQRRSERLVDVPISVTAINGSQLSSAGVVSITDLSTLVPGLNYQNIGPWGQPTIRGIGTTLTGPGANPAVAIYVDGVYSPNQASSVFDLNNIDDVEVLKGPQGTLFGRNATGGAILIRTLAPSFTPGGSLGVNDGVYSNLNGAFNDFKANGYITGGIISDVVAGSLAFSYRNGQGYLYNVATKRYEGGPNSYQIMPKLLIKASNNLRFTLSGTVRYNSDPYLQAYSAYLGENNILIQNPGLVRTSEPYQVALNTTTISRTHTYGGSLTVDWDTSIGKVTSISSYFDMSLFEVVDLDRTAATVPANGGVSIYHDGEKTGTQEVSLATPKFGIFSVTAGLYYYNDVAIRQLDGAATPSATPSTSTFARLHDIAYAGFSELNINPTDKLHFILGGRYNTESTHATAVRTIGVGAPVDAKGTWNSFTPRAVVRYELTDQSNVYASYSKGFKSGIFNAISLESIPVKPEYVNSYEIGYKYGKGSTSFAASGFYEHYTDLQVQSLDASNVVHLNNAAKAEIYGAEAELHTHLTDNFSIDAGATYTHAKYLDYPGAQLTVKNPTTGLISTVIGNAGGNDMARSPRFTGNFTARYEHELMQGKFAISGTAYHNDGFSWTADNRVKQPAYTTLDGEISWSTPDNRWRFSIWGRNMTGEKYLSSVLETAAGTQGIWADPAEYGVGVSTHF